MNVVTPRSTPSGAGFYRLKRNLVERLRRSQAIKDFL
jgi:hypothetical protein